MPGILDLFYAKILAMIISTKNTSEIVKTQRQLISVIQANKNNICAFGVRKLGVFGSFSRGEQNTESDIDLLVEFEPNRKNYDSFIQLVFYLEEIFGRKVELVTTESLSPYLGPHIIQEVDYVLLGG